MISLYANKGEREVVMEGRIGSDNKGALVRKGVCVCVSLTSTVGLKMFFGGARHLAVSLVVPCTPSLVAP